MEPLASPLHIPLVEPRRVTWAVLILHGIALVLLLAGFSASFGRTLAICALVTSVVHYMLVQRRLYGRIEALLLGSNNQWHLVSCDGVLEENICAKLLFRSPLLIVLSLQRPRAATHHVVLTRENVAADTFRRLNVRLRLPP